MPSSSKKLPAKAKTPASTKSGERKDEHFEVPQDEQDAVKLWLGRIERAETNTKRKVWKDDLERQRGYVYGTTKKDEAGKEQTRTNLVFATIAALMPHLYARDPDIAVTPAKGCPDARLAQVKKFSETAMAVIAQMFVREPKLKKRAKSNIRSTMTTSYGVLKMVLQEDLHGDPLVIRRINDAQDNIARIEALSKDKSQNPDILSLGSEREQARALIEGLLAGNEVKIYKGLVIDRVASENFLILDESIVEFDEYVDAGALCQLVYMTVDDFKVKFGYQPWGATTYSEPTSKNDGNGQQQSQGGTPEGKKPGDMFVCVAEVWSKTDQVIYTVAKGMNRWCRPPIAPKYTPQRWYGFYVLGFNLVEGRWRPNSDVEMLANLQDEYSETRQNFADVRKDAVPIRVFRKAGGLTPEDIQELSKKRRNRDWIGVEGSPTVALKDDIQQLDGPKIDPQAYDVSLIRNDMDLVVGLSDASRANLIKAKTATEAEIMQQALGLRVGERRDSNEDLMSEMAEAALEIALRALSKSEVQQIAGEGAEWPEGADIDEIFSLVSVNVRAGSSGLPDEAKEREQWTQLLPMVQKTMETVAALRTQGQYELADAAVELLRETLRRFQERIDIDAIIPPVQKGEDGKPVQNAANMLQQATQQNAQLQEQLKECQAALTKAQAQEQSRTAKVAADKQLSSERIQADKEVAVAEAGAKADLEKHLAIVRAAAEIISAGERAGGERMQVSEIVTQLSATMKTLEEAVNAVKSGAAAPAAAPASA